MILCIWKARSAWILKRIPQYLFTVLFLSTVKPCDFSAEETGKELYQCSCEKPFIASVSSWKLQWDCSSLWYQGKRINIWEIYCRFRSPEEISQQQASMVLWMFILSCSLFFLLPPAHLTCIVIDFYLVDRPQYTHIWCLGEAEPRWKGFTLLWETLIFLKSSDTDIMNSKNSNLEQRLLFVPENIWEHFNTRNKEEPCVLLRGLGFLTWSFLLELVHFICSLLYNKLNL